MAGTSPAMTTECCRSARSDALLRNRRQQIGEMALPDAVDRPALAYAIEDELDIVVGLGILPRHVEQEMRMFDVGSHVLDIGGLLLEGNAGPVAELHGHSGGP